MKRNDRNTFAARHSTRAPAVFVLALALAAAPASAQDPKPRLAIAAIAAEGVPEELAAGVTETIATAIARTGVFETISPRQLAALLAFEKRKELLGACVDERCYAQIATAVRAEHLLAGSIARVNDSSLVLNLVLVEAKSSSSLERAERQTADAQTLLEASRAAAVVVLQPLLTRHAGYVKLTSNVPDAALAIDDRRRSELPGQVLALAAGPHVVEVSKEGFYRATLEVLVTPSRVVTHDVTLVPARETIESYERSAKLMRYGAIGTGVLAVGAAVLSAVFYSAASDDKAKVDQFTSALEIDRSRAGLRNEAVAAKSSFEANQSLYLVSLGTATLSAAASAVLLLAGDDPDRYAEFRETQTP